ncbi:MAG: DUF6448 family protein [Gemmatimonadales bacterium]|jgi:hypothetical protein
MIMRSIATTLSVLAVLFAGSLTLPPAAAAHCDSMDGPVVKAAQQALATDNVNLVLVWVRPEDEPEIREAFRRTMTVRRLGGEAEALADRWFFETLVRVHRAGEGEPYTGLKPAGYEPPAGIAAADRAVDVGSVDTLAQALTEHLEAELRRRFERVQALSDYAPDDVAAGRVYVQAYVRFIHFVEQLHALIEGEGGPVHG